MKKAKLLQSSILLIIVLMSVLTFAKNHNKFATTHWYQYTGLYPVDDTRVITSTNYMEVTLTCVTPRQKWCGFCIDDDSQYWDATAGTPKWGDSGFQSLLKDGSPNEVYNNTSLHGTDIGSHVRVYFKAN